MTRYLLDTNIYINFYERYYRFDYFPSFWTRLETVLNEQVVIPKVVLDENYQGEAFIAWINQFFTQEVVNHKDYAEEWAEILNHVQTCGNYQDIALSSDKGWAHERIADPWILAIAKKENLVIVTDEIKNVNLNKANPSKLVKIPDVASDLGIKCMTMNEFFGEIGLNI